MSTEKAIIDHYTRGDLKTTILDVVRQTAADPAKLTIDDLAAYDEFHIGGRRATEYFMAMLKLTPDTDVLDVGCGIGGAVRFSAQIYNTRTTGIDLTPEFITTAETLTDIVSLQDRVNFKVASATALPFEDNTFDTAFTIHAAMNIEDKLGMYREAARVLKPGAVFGIYDIMAGAPDGVLDFPMPWSTHPETSFLITPDEVVSLLSDAGFEVTYREDRRDFARETFKRMVDDKDSPAGKLQQSLRKADMPQKKANLVRQVEQGRCSPYIIICKKI